MTEQMRSRRRVHQEVHACCGYFVAVAIILGLLVGSGLGRALPVVQATAAQPSQAKPAAGLSDGGATVALAPANPTTYLLGPGDTLRVSVFGHDELTLELTVRPDGRISYPLVGDLEVRGQTTSQVAAQIQQVLQTYVKSPQVTVMVTQFRQVRVQVSGEVARPGLYALPVGARVLDALGQAGGWTRQAAVGRLLLIRGGQAERLDLRPAIEEGQTEPNLALVDGDILYLPAGATAIIWGEVRTPGAYTLAEKTNLVQLLAVAGGALPSANLQGVQVTRVDEAGRPQRTTLTAEQVQQWQIQPDDIVYVPAVQAVTVLGAVAKPGRYPLGDGGTRLWDVLAQAGGTTAAAALHRVTVTRAQADGSPTSTVLDLSSTADSGVPVAGAYLLQANDLVYVPEGRPEIVILGQVQRPGVVPWRAGMRLLDVLGEAGGLTEQAAGEQSILAQAKSGQTVTVDLTSLQQNPSAAQNLMVEPGDTLFVPAGRRQVAILGEVARPGVYPLTPGLRLVDVVAAAGGVTAQARQGGALLTRLDPHTGEPSRPQEIQLFPPAGSAPTRAAGELRGSDLARAGDVLYVPASLQTATVLGEVARPGQYPVQPGWRILDLLAAAGGPTDRADLTQVTYAPATAPEAGSRATPGGTQSTERLTAGQSPDSKPTGEIVTTLDLAQIQAAPQSSANRAVQPGDVLVIARNERWVSTLGEWVKPVTLPWRAGLTLGELVSQAGGPTRTADLSHVTLIRQAGEAVTYQTVSLRQWLGEASDGTGSAVGTLANANANVDTGAGAPGAPQAAATVEMEVDASFPLQPGDVLLARPLPVAEVVILGQVQRPGVVPWRPGMRLLDVLGAAGGLTDQAAGERAVWARAQDGETATIDLTKLLQAKDGPGNLPVRPGDTLFVPNTNRQATVLGEVARPGVYPLTPGARLVDLIAAAGGVTAQAKQGQALLTRVDPQTGEPFAPVWVRLFPSTPPSAGAEVGQADEASSAEGASSTPATGVAGDADRAGATWPGNEPAQPGDVLYVPAMAQTATVLGEVARPGQYAVQAGWRVLDLLAAAGGATAQADLTQVTYSPASAVGPGRTAAGTAGLAANGNAETITLDLGRVQAAPQSRENRLVQPGDVLVVARNERWVSALGEWLKPVTLPWRPGLTLGELVAQAGGPPPQADLAHVTLIRRGAGGLEYRTLDLAEWLSSNQSGAAVTDPAKRVDAGFALQPGDVLLVKPLTPVVVLGQVARPGAYPAAGQSLMQAVAQAGGVTVTGDASQVIWSRPAAGGGSEVVDLSAAPGAAGPAPVGRQVVSPGDVIYVPENRRAVLVLGEVRAPQQVTVWSGMTLLEALARAGGPSPSADLERALFSQEGQVRTINLRSVLDNPLSPENVVLRGGEALILPKRLQAVAVLGAVGRPGSYTLEEPATVVGAIAAAGGALPSADLSAATLTQTGPGADGERLTRQVDLASALADPSGSANVRIKGGDILLVPERERRVLVYGAVRSPGAYVVTPKARVLDALALAGGPTEQADLAALTLTRVQPSPEGAVGAAVPTGTTEAGPTEGQPMAAESNAGQQVLDLAALLRNPQDPANQLLAPGDVLYLPAARQVAILGQVARPGMYTLPAGSRLLDLVALAGGPTERAADGFTVLRTPLGQTAPQVLEANYQAVLGNAQPAQNLVLQPGDTVYVPEGRKQVLVLGQVRNPGLYSIRPGMTVLDVIGLAGGPSERAKLEAVGIYRSGEAGAATVQLGKDKVVFQGNVSENPLVQGGDIVYVPETSKPDWNAIFGFLGGVKLFKDLLGIQIQW